MKLKEVLQDMKDEIFIAADQPAYWCYETTPRFARKLVKAVQKRRLPLALTIGPECAGRVDVVCAFHPQYRECTEFHGRLDLGADYVKHAVSSTVRWINRDS